MENLFFKKKNNLKINDILNCLNLKKIKKNIKVNDIKELDKANQNDITFIHSLKYKESLKRTKSKLLITKSSILLSLITWWSIGPGKTSETSIVTFVFMSLSKISIWYFVGK